MVGGAVIANSVELAERLQWWANCAGLTGAPYDSWQTLRGLKTLHARMAFQERNARKLAEWLSHHNKIEKVYYPGLETNPDYDLAQKQQEGPGAMLSCEISGGLSQTKAFLSKLTLFQLCLLYTSPSPRDKRQSRMPSSA